MLRLLRSRTGVLLTLSMLVVAAGAGLRQRSTSPLLGQASSGPPTTWNVVPGMPGFRQAAFGNGRIVGIGAGGSAGAVYSDDGVTWTTVEKILGPITANVTDIAFGNGRFVAVGYDSKISYSTDGATWTPVNMPPAQQVNLGIIESITYGGGKFVAVGMGAAAVSVNGITWQQAPGGPTGGIDKSLVYGNGTFVSVGMFGGGFGSPDGLTWTKITDMKVGQASLSHVAFGNGMFVAFGEHGWGTTSPDGITWTKIPDTTFGENQRINGVTFGNGYFVAVGGTNKAAYSTDGIAWTAINDIKLDAWLGGLSVVFGDGRFIVPSSGKGTYSGAAITPSAQSSSASSSAFVSIQGSSSGNRSGCGNGTPETGEGCDDGNLIDGDGCSATCAVETGWQCTDECASGISALGPDRPGGMAHLLASVVQLAVVCNCNSTNCPAPAFCSNCTCMWGAPPVSSAPCCVPGQCGAGSTCTGCTCMPLVFPPTPSSASCCNTTSCPLPGICSGCTCLAGPPPIPSSSPATCCTPGGCGPAMMCSACVCMPIPVIPSSSAASCCMVSGCGPGMICSGCTCMPIPNFSSASSSSCCTQGSCPAPAHCEFCGCVWPVPSSSSASSASVQTCPPGYTCSTMGTNGTCAFVDPPAGCQLTYSGTCGAGACTGGCWRCAGALSSGGASSTFVPVSSSASCVPPPDCTVPPPPCFRGPPTFVNGCMVSCGPVTCLSSFSSAFSVISTGASSAAPATSSVAAASSSAGGASSAASSGSSDGTLFFCPKSSWPCDVFVSFSCGGGITNAIDYQGLFSASLQETGIITNGVGTVHGGEVFGGTFVADFGYEPGRLKFPAQGKIDQNEGALLLEIVPVRNHQSTRPKPGVIFWTGIKGVDELELSLADIQGGSDSPKGNLVLKRISGGREVWRISYAMAFSGGNMWNPVLILWGPEGIKLGGYPMSFPDNTPSGLSAIDVTGPLIPVGTDLYLGDAAGELGLTFRNFQLCGNEAGPILPITAGSSSASAASTRCRSECHRNTLATVVSSSSSSVSAGSAVCGNGQIESGEECETGHSCAGSATCDNACRCVTAVSSSVNAESTSSSPRCGNGNLEGTEQCETGHLCPDGGFCAAGCVCEAARERFTRSAAEDSRQIQRCGDGFLDPGEACDDGNTRPGDGCSAFCTIEMPGQIGALALCGNGLSEPPGEECDDGNQVNGDGCSDHCTRELHTFPPDQPLEISLVPEREPVSPPSPAPEFPFEPVPVPSVGGEVTLPPLSPPAGLPAPATALPDAAWSFSANTNADATHPNLIRERASASIAPRGVPMYPAAFPSPAASPGTNPVTPSFANSPSPWQVPSYASVTPYPYASSTGPAGETGPAAAAVMAAGAAAGWAFMRRKKSGSTENV